MKFSGPTYDKLKFIAQIVLPALATLYLTLGALWDLPKPQEVAATIVALDTFLGICLQISSTNFQGDSTLNVFQDPTGKKVFDLALDMEPEDLEDKDVVRLKVKKQRTRHTP
jgi:hypothetical protein